MSLARQGRVSWAHAATPCQSNTWGRSPQLRTEEHLYDGCPGIGKRQSEMVQAGTALVLWTCEFLTEVHASGGYASLENPVRSWIWWFMEVRALKDMVGWAAVMFPQCQWDTPYWKDTIIMHNLPTFHLLNHGDEHEAPQVKLRGRLFYEGQWRWRTSLSASYPPGMALEMMRLAAQALRLQGEGQVHALEEYDAGIPSDWADEDEMELSEQYLQELMADTDSLVPRGGGAHKGIKGGLSPSSLAKERQNPMGQGNRNTGPYTDRTATEVGKTRQPPVTASMASTKPIATAPTHLKAPRAETQSHRHSRLRDPALDRHPSEH